MYDKLLNLGAVTLQLHSGVQHIKAVVRDFQIITNCGSANLSFGGIGGSNDGEYGFNKQHNHSEFELMSMILLTLLAFEEFVN